MNIEIKTPQLPESINDATILTWHKKVGDPVMRDETLLELETDKVILEVPAPENGVMGEILKAEGSIVQAQDLLAMLDISQVANIIKKEAIPTPEVAPTKSENTNLSPSVRQLVHKFDIDTSQIKGTGRDGRLLKSDVMAWLDQQEITPAITSAPEPLIDNSANQMEQRVPMTRLRAKIAERLVEAQQTSATLTTFNEVNLQQIVGLRSKYKTTFEQNHETKLGFMSFFVQASIEALKKFPAINASIDGQDIIYHNYYNIGIAVGSPRGLIVPVLKNTEQMSFADIEKQIREYGQKAQDGSIIYEALQGGTFSISNGGVYGSMLSTPILNLPQSAILGMHNIIQRPIAENNQVVIRPMMYLALSYDHRIVDGKEAVQFLVMIKDLLEDPVRLLLHI